MNDSLNEIRWIDVLINTLQAFDIYLKIITCKELIVKQFQFENIVMHLFNKTKIYMTPEEPVITHHMSYFKALADIVEGTSKRSVISNYYYLFTNQKRRN